jgi:hypothetical protein
MDLIFDSRKARNRNQEPVAANISRFRLPKAPSATRFISNWAYTPYSSSALCREWVATTTTENYLGKRPSSEWRVTRVALLLRKFNVSKRLHPLQLSSSTAPKSFSVANDNSLLVHAGSKFLIIDIPPPGFALPSFPVSLSSIVPHSPELPSASQPHSLTHRQIIKQSAGGANNITGSSNGGGQQETAHQPDDVPEEAGNPPLKKEPERPLGSGNEKKTAIARKRKRKAPDPPPTNMGCYLYKINPSLHAACQRETFESDHDLRVGHT